MKRTKKLLALVLAMMMALSIMAVTAAAYDAEDAHEHTAACCDEGIMPRKPAGRCPECGVWGTYERKKGEDGKRADYYDICGHVVPLD